MGDEGSAVAPEGNALSSQLGEQTKRALVAAYGRRAGAGGGGGGGLLAVAPTSWRSVGGGHGVTTACAGGLRSGSEQSMGRTIFVCKSTSTTSWIADQRLDRLRRAASVPLVQFTHLSIIVQCTCFCSGLSIGSDAMTSMISRG